MATLLRKTGRTTQDTVSRAQRQALRWAIVQQATFTDVAEHPGQQTYDVHIPAPEFGGERVYLGRVGLSAHGNAGVEPITLGWDYKYADDVIGRQPWQSGRSVKTRELAAYRLLPDTI